MEIFPLISFLTGVISILSPCILPILPIFVGSALKSKSKSELISFILGLFTVFTAIIFLTGFFTFAVYKYISYVRIVCAVILLIFAVCLFTGYSFSFAKLTPRNHDGVIGSFFLGFLTSLAWTPCYSAYLISLITLLVTSGSPLFAAFNIILYCLGFALTLLVLGFLLSEVNMEKIIKKTEIIPKIFAVLIIVSAVYILFF